MVAKSVPQRPAPLTPGQQQPEQRTAALFPCSIRLLDALGCADALASVSAPLLAIRLIDMTGGLMRAPEVVFSAAEADEPYLALNIPNADLTFALMQQAIAAGATLLADTSVTGLTATSDGAILSLSDGRAISARIVVAADGRHSACREAAGIPCETWRYDQAALVCSFRHDRPHHGISTEIHHSAGPCTTVPLPGDMSSLVWVERPAVVARLLDLCAADFNDALHQRLNGLLGTVDTITPRRSYPLAGLVASTMAKGCIALVGETGHALPPIGAQGLNLGLADVAVLADELAAAAGRTAGDVGLALAAYARRRAGDITRRAGAVDLLNRTLERGSTAMHMIRGAGLHVLAALPAARRTMIAQGLAPPSPVPRLMLGDRRSAY